MKWRFPIFVSAVLFVFLFGLFITTGDTFAVSDISATFTSSSAYSPVFPDCDSTCLSQYSYFIISSTTNNLSNIIFDIGSNKTLNVIFPYYGGSNNTSSFVIIQDFNYSTFNFRYTQNFSVPITLTLSETSSYGAVLPSGNIDIIDNGQYDVTNYATATVNVSPEVIQGDYHDDLVSINNSIIICAAVCLVLYFFYCIYRLIIRNSGVK